MDDKIIRAKKENWIICIYGLGTIWNNVGNEYLRILNLSPDYYCDTNTDVLNSFKEVKQDEQKPVADANVAQEVNKNRELTGEVKQAFASVANS